MTDANIVLGRLLPHHFPQIFGPEENEPLDKAASEEAMNRLLAEVTCVEEQMIVTKLRTITVYFSNITFIFVVCFLVKYNVVLEVLRMKMF